MPDVVAPAENVCSEVHVFAPESDAPLPAPIHVPAIEKQPEVRLIPFAKEDEADVEVAVMVPKIPLPPVTVAEVIDDVAISVPAVSFPIVAFALVIELVAVRLPTVSVPTMALARVAVEVAVSVPIDALYAVRTRTVSVSIYAASAFKKVDTLRPAVVEVPDIVDDAADTPLPPARVSVPVIERFVAVALVIVAFPPVILVM